MGFVVRFVRHGEMALNRPENYGNIIKTGLNGPLTGRGIAEVETLGRVLNSVKFDRAYSSDFTRALETAKYILKHSNNSVPEVIVEKRVRERDSGEWTEKTPMDMIKAAMAAQIYPHFLPCPGGESVEEVMQRAADFFQELCNTADESSKDENILVTTHGAWLASFLEYLISHPELYELENCDVNLARKPAPTTGVTQILLGKKEAGGVRRLNFIQLHDQQHLENQVLPD